MIAALIIFAYTRCVRSTVAGGRCSVVAVVWQLGLVRLLGFELDPYSILVPFLVFAIGVCHGAQKMNGIMQDIGRGTHRLVAARYTFRRLFLAGLTALLADVVGFAVLMVIDIPVIQDLALTASIGVAVLIFTNLILLPVLLSYVGVSPAAARAACARKTKRRARESARCGLLDRFTERRWAMGAIGVRGAARRAASWSAAACRSATSSRGAPELRPDSRYNRDNAYITAQLRAVQRPVRGDREDAAEAASTTRRWSRPTAWPGRCSSARRADHGVAGDAVRRSPPARSRATRSGSRSRATRTCSTTAASRLGEQPGPVQHRVLGAAGDRLPDRPQGRDARPRGRHRRGFAPSNSDADVPVPAGRRQRRHRGGDQHRGARGQPHDAALRLRRGDRCCASSPSAAGARWWWRCCRWC